MKIFFLLLSLATSGSYGGTNLLLIGGGRRPPEAMKRFVDLSGAKNSRILIIPWASETLESSHTTAQELISLGAGKIEIASPFPMSNVNYQKLIESLKMASGIFFVGGDQNVLMKAILNLKLKALIKNLFSSGIAFAGTSAGTAIMSESMLTGEADLTIIDGKKVGRAEGLGLLPSHILVDQHFVKRGRFNRMAGVILMTREIGIGIDENTALLIENNRAVVIGPTQVLIFKARAPKKLELDVLTHGDHLLL